VCLSVCVVSDLSVWSSVNDAAMFTRLLPMISAFVSPLVTANPQVYLTC